MAITPNARHSTVMSDAVGAIGLVQILEWSGCCFGLLGSALLALNNRYSGYGFPVFLVSNGFWIVFGFLTGAMGMVVMQIGFTATSLIGAWNWLIKARRNEPLAASLGERPNTECLIHKKCG